MPNTVGNEAFTMLDPWPVRGFDANARLTLPFGWDLARKHIRVFPPSIVVNQLFRGDAYELAELVPTTLINASRALLPEWE